MVESSGSVPIQGTPQIIKQVPRSLSTLEIWEYIANHQSYDTRTSTPPNKPPHGSIILYDKSVVDFFRKDGYEWKLEDHNTRKGYYARGISNDNLQRRLYWLKEEKHPNSNIVVAHYLEEPRRRSTTTTIKNGEGHVQDKKRKIVTKYETGSSSWTNVQDKKRIKKVTEYETGSSSWTNSNHQANYGIASRVHHLHQLVHSSSAILDKNDWMSDEDYQLSDDLHRLLEESGTEPHPGIPQSIDIGPSCSEKLNHQANAGSTVQDDQLFDQASFGMDYRQNLYNEETGPISWINHQANTESSILSADHEHLSEHFGDTGAAIDASTEIISPPMSESPVGSNVVICSIEDFAPGWGYAYTSTKVLITGRFINSDQPRGESCQWYCVFGENVVSAEHLSVRNLRCYTPLKMAGRVEFYVKTSHGSCSEVMLFEFRDDQNQETDYNGSYSNIEVSQTGFSKPLPTSITPLTIDPSHEQRMSEVDQVPGLLELLCEAPPDDKDCHHIDAMQAPTKYGAKNKSRRWYQGVSDFLLKLRVKVGLLPSSKL